MKNKLPSPRFELKWIKSGKDWKKKECIYSLVLPLGEWDIRRENENGKPVRDEKSVELGRTRVSGLDDIKPIRDGKVDTPFRDHSHAIWDSKSLGNIPIFAICGDVYTKVEEGV